VAYRERRSGGIDVRPRHIALLAGLAIVVLPALAVLIEAAGKGVAVAVAAIATLVASYVRIGRLTVHSFGDEDARERVQRAGRAHILIMLGTPLVLIAAHPWGMATFAVAGAVLICQVLFVHAMIVAGLILQRRARMTPPR
jgi:hypothetical protein